VTPRRRTVAAGEEKGVPLALAEEGNDLLYRYLSRERFEKQCGCYHPDPMIDEFSYGEGGGFSAFVWNNINVGSRVFFHTMIGGTRYLTAMYYVTDFAPAAVWRADGRMRARYRNPHLHPENYPDWAGDDALARPVDEKTRTAYSQGGIAVDVDVVLIGDPGRSFEVRKSPVVLDKEVMARLDMKGKPVKWDIVDKRGTRFGETRCISACLRTPRGLSRTDGNFLEALVAKAAGIVRGEKSFSAITAMDPFVASEIQLACSTEEEIEAYLIRNLDVLDGGLKFLANQLALADGGRIDILAETRAGAPVVIEIKKGTADDGTLAQLLTYIHQYARERSGQQPAGKIVCADASYRLRTACDHLGIMVHCYGDILLRRVEQTPPQLLGQRAAGA
jgi:hypothetical protein